MGRVLLRRDVFSWCLYDWANSAFITSVMVAILPGGYYDSLFEDPASVPVGLLGLRWTSSSDALWAYTNSAFMVAVAIAAPVLGAMADAGRAKKRFLAFCAVGGSLLTVGLALPGQGQWPAVSVLFALAAFLWTAANIFYDGFLPELDNSPERMDAISGAGYGLGYLGGGLMLGLNMAMIRHPGWFGLGGVESAARWSFVLVGLWWAAFTVPLLLWVGEGVGPGGGRGAVRRGAGLVRTGFARLRATLGKVGRLPELAKFLLAFLLYNSGIGTIFIVAAKFATSDPATGGLGLSAATTIGALLMVQFVGLPAAFGFIWLARRVGTRNSIFIGIGVYIAVVIYAIWLGPGMELRVVGLTITTEGLFCVLAFLLALVQGGTQAMSRSLFATMVPPGMSAEFFGFFSIFNKVGAFLGPLAFAIARDATGSMRMGILFLIVFFALGLSALLAVRTGRGAEQARAFSATVQTA